VPGSEAFRLEDRTLLSPPTVATQPATNVTSTSATLQASVDPNGLSTGARFQFSTDPGLVPNVVTLFAGSPGVRDNRDGTGTDAAFYSPTSLATDAAGNIYVADSNNDTIRKITPDGVVTTLAGSPGHAGSTNGQGSAALFSQPYAVAVDGSGNVYVAELLNNDIRKITPDGTVSTFAGAAGQAGSVDGTGTAARFFDPDGIATDSAGNVYVSDFGQPNDAGMGGNATIRKITPDGVVTTLAGTPGVLGSADGTGAAAQFRVPAGLATDRAGNVYVAEFLDNTIRKITPSGVVTTLAGSPGAQGSVDGIGAAAVFNRPWALTVDPAGDVYETDSGNDTIRRITPDGVVTTIAGSVRVQGDDNGVGSAATFSAPFGIVMSPMGDLYVSTFNSSTIRKLTVPTIGVSVTPGGTVTGSLTGLQPGTTYYDRILAFNADGSSVGAILSFTTPATPTPTTPTPTSPTPTPTSPTPTPTPTPAPHATAIAAGARTKKGLSSITVAFDEALNSGSATSAGNYSLLAAVKKGRKTTFKKPVAIRNATYDAGAHRVTINLAKPFKGAIQVTVHGGIKASNGASSSGDLTQVVS
jgi:sugar lactone lactonase YvrE